MRNPHDGVNGRGVDHHSSAHDAASVAVAWMADRFTGAPPPDDCRRQLRHFQTEQECLRSNAGAGGAGIHWLQHRRASLAVRDDDSLC
jgi:hypothetical protein